MRDAPENAIDEFRGVPLAFEEVLVHTDGVLPRTKAVAQLSLHHAAHDAKNDLHVLPSLRLVQLALQAPERGLVLALDVLIARTIAPRIEPPGENSMRPPSEYVRDATNALVLRVLVVYKFSEVVERRTELTSMPMLHCSPEYARGLVPSLCNQSLLQYCELVIEYSLAIFRVPFEHALPPFSKALTHWTQKPTSKKSVQLPVSLISHVAFKRFDAHSVIPFGRIERSVNVPQPKRKALGPRRDAGMVYSPRAVAHEKKSPLFLLHRIMTHKNIVRVPLAKASC